MTATVTDMVVSDLITMYSGEPSFNEDKIAVIVRKVVSEVIKARRYKEAKYTDEQIDNDLMNYQSQIYNLAEYDFLKFGASHETSHSENSISRTWTERSKLFVGIIPLSCF